MEGGREGGKEKSQDDLAVKEKNQQIKRNKICIFSLWATVK